MPSPTKAAPTAKTKAEHRPEVPLQRYFVIQAEASRDGWQETLRRAETAGLTLHSWHFQPASYKILAVFERPEANVRPDEEVLLALAA